MRFAQLLPKHTAYQKDMQVAYARKMEKSESLRRARRRKRLEELLSEFGGAAQVARESGTPKSHFSAMLAAKRGLGDELAEKLEILYVKPRGWFDLVVIDEAHASSAESHAINEESRLATVQAPAGPTVAHLDQRAGQRRRSTGLDVLNHLIEILEKSDAAAREGLAGALPGLARNPSDPRAIAAVKAWIAPGELEHRKQAHG